MKNDTSFIRAGWMIDGSGAPIQRNVVLTVEKGIISAISSFRAGDSPDPALLTDLSHCTILPPLVDCHVHLALSSSTDPEFRERQLSSSYEECIPRMAEHLHYLFSHGVLAVRDGGDRFGHVLRYKNETAGREGKRDPVILKTTGPAWHQKGRYGSFMGKTPAGDVSLATNVSWEIDTIDHVKIINSGLNSITEYGKKTSPQFSLKELQDLVTLAGQKEKKVMVHANGTLPVRMAIEAGCHSVEHGFFMGKDNLCRMADNETVWVPTAVTIKSLLDNWELGHKQGNREVISQILESQLGQMELAKQYGVQLALGTDAGCSGILHGESVVEELKLFLKAGYSLVEAVACASSNGAKLLGLDTMGTIATGRPAHFLVARATPAMLPRKLSYLETIYLDGRACDKAFFNKI